MKRTASDLSTIRESTFVPGGGGGGGEDVKGGTEIFSGIKGGGSESSWYTEGGL
jgi:hypothetical protein